MGESARNPYCAYFDDDRRKTSLIESYSNTFLVVGIHVGTGSGACGVCVCVVVTHVNRTFRVGPV